MPPPRGNPGSATAAPKSACKYVEEIGSAAMLAGNSLTGVAPEVNLREHVTCVPLLNVNMALKPKDDAIRSPKQGYQ